MHQLHMIFEEVLSKHFVNRCTPMSKLNNVIPYTGVHHADHLPKLCGPALELPGAGHVQAEQQQAGEDHGHPHGVIIITMISV